MIASLLHSVSQEIQDFEKGLLIEESKIRLSKATETLKRQKERTKRVQRKLEKSDSELEAQTSQINQQKNDLERVQNELEAKLQKEKNISEKYSISASKMRGCEEVDEFLQMLVRDHPNKGTKELWVLIPGERDGGDFYRENDKMHHNECGCREFGIQAFYARIQKIKNPIKILANEAK